MDRCAICLWPLGDTPHPVHIDHPTLGTRTWHWVHDECFAAQLSFEAARRATL
jgi:hypothetical protein